MDLYTDGSGVTVFDRDSGAQVAIFQSHPQHAIQGRHEARRYTGLRLIVEAAQDLLRASASDQPGDLLGAAHLLQQALDDAGIALDVEDHQALDVIRKRVKTPAAPDTDKSTTPVESDTKKPRNSGPRSGR